MNATLTTSSLARSPRPTCTATSRTGVRCRQTAIRGGTVCRFHGGASPQVIKAARRRLAEEAIVATAAKLGIVGTDPLSAIQQAVDIPSSVVAAILNQLAQSGKSLDSLDAVESSILGDWIDRGLRAGKVATDLGIAERKLALRAAELTRIGDAVRDAVASPEFGLTPQAQQGILEKVGRALSGQPL